jgi:hypothetical protein
LLPHLLFRLGINHAYCRLCGSWSASPCEVSTLNNASAHVFNAAKSRKRRRHYLLVFRSTFLVSDFGSTTTSDSVPPTMPSPPPSSKDPSVNGVAQHQQAISPPVPQPHLILKLKLAGALVRKIKLDNSQSLAKDQKNEPFQNGAAMRKQPPPLTITLPPPFARFRQLPHLSNEAFSSEAKPHPPIPPQPRLTIRIKVPKLVKATWLSNGINSRLPPPPAQHQIQRQPNAIRAHKHSHQGGVSRGPVSSHPPDVRRREHISHPLLITLNTVLCGSQGQSLYSSLLREVRLLGPLSL